MIGQENSETSGIKLLTFNTFMRPPGIKNNQDDYKDERLGDILREIEKYDIVCFQEMFGWGSSRRDKLIEEAIKRKFYYVVVAPIPDFGWGPIVDGGLCVLSRFPILEGSFTSYGLGVLSDAACDKGFIYCRIQIGDSILNLFNTHLQASYFGSSEQQRKASRRVRLEQLIFLHNKMNQIMENKNQLCLLVGDLNFKGHEKEEYEQLMSIVRSPKVKVYDCLYQRYGKQPITFGENDRVLTGKLDWNSEQRLDYILHFQFENSSSSLIPMTERCSVEKFLIEKRPYSQLSDHYGASIELKQI